VAARHDLGIAEPSEEGDNVNDLSAREQSSESLLHCAKRELRTRYARGERPTAWEYLNRFSCLREDRDLAVSLIYEEFCLLEEAGECPESVGFCERYPFWRDSLEVQVHYHRQLDKLAPNVRPQPALPQPGDEWCGFSIDSVLGRGGTSIVYLAYERAMGDRFVALKVSRDRGPEPSIIGCLDHPRIMPAFSVCRDRLNGLRGLCMPYRSGKPLDCLVRQAWPFRRSQGAATFWAVLAAQGGAGPTPALDQPGWSGFPSTGVYEEGVAWITAVVSMAVSHVHSCGITHCDIKPSNVYVALREGPLLFDFGFARSHSAWEPPLGGTLAYMAPEQLRAFLDPKSRIKVGPAADIYAIGLTMLDLLLGTPEEFHPPASPASLAARDLLNRRSQSDWLAKIVSHRIPGALAEIMQRCVMPSPNERYANANELAHELLQFLAVSQKQPIVQPNRAGALTPMGLVETGFDLLPSIVTAPAAACP
jgi:serine/threonine protein kinase